KFKVYYADCSVEYVGSYGSPLPTTGVEDTEAAESIILYPNPTNDVLFISNPSPQDAVGFMVDVMGRRVRDGIRIRGGGTTEIFLANLPPGVYVLAAAFSNGGTFTDKVMKR